MRLGLGPLRRRRGRPRQIARVEIIGILLERQRHGASLATWITSYYLIKYGQSILLIRGWLPVPLIRSRPFHEFGSDTNQAGSRVTSRHASLGPLHRSIISRAGHDRPRGCLIAIGVSLPSGR